MVAGENLMFLMDYAYLVKDDVLLNGTTFSWPERIMPMIHNTCVGCFCVCICYKCYRVFLTNLETKNISCSELKLGREHDIATSRLRDQKRRFLEALTRTQKQVVEFKSKDRMGDAESYVQLLEEIAKKLEHFNQEVRWIFQL